MSINIFHRRHQVAQSLGEKAHQTVAQLAEALGISKSSAQRHRHAIQSQQADPVSAFWSSPAGMEYLVRVVVLVVYCFGIKGGVGAESISRFFSLVGIERHVGTSASAIRRLKQQLLEQIHRFGSIQQSRVSLPDGKRVVLGSDETFFNHPLLVLMELSSGYLLLEVEKLRRTFEHWNEAIEAVELPSGWQVEAMVSDGASALIKLAVETFECLSFPDVFHLLHNLGAPMVKQLGREDQRLERETTRLSQAQDNCRRPKQRATNEQQQREIQQQRTQLDDWQRQYQESITALTTLLHPFELDSGQWQLWGELEQRLNAPLRQLDQLAQQMNLDAQTKAVEAFRTQIPSLSDGIAQWWKGTLDQLYQRTQDESLQQWVITRLLPYCYWHQQAFKTRTPALKTIYQQAAQAAQQRLNTHPLSALLSPEESEQWQHWAQQQCVCFQRTSSAIEGRNGTLSRLHHALRGFSPQMLQALTIIHNFDTFRADGTSPAQRLFDHSFPSLPEWLVHNTHQLPLPRKSKKEQTTQPLSNNAFPA